MINNEIYDMNMNYILFYFKSFDYPGKYSITLYSCLLFEATANRLLDFFPVTITIFS